MSSILNVSKVVELVGPTNNYSYTRVKNLLNGLKGKTSKAEIKKLRITLRNEFKKIIDQIEALELES